LTLLVGRQEEHPTCKNRVTKGKTSLDLNEARDVLGFGMAAASAGPHHANSPHLAPDRQPITAPTPITQK